MSIVTNRRATNLHYGWVIAFTGTMVTFACLGLGCLGLGRLTLGMFLPSMGVALNLSYTRMCLIGTGNFVGYMLAVAFADYVAKRLGARLTITLGLVLVGVTLILIGRAEHYLQILLLFIATGVGSGLSYVPLLGLVSHWFLKKARGRAAGIMLSGIGIAILSTGLYVPWINTQFSLEGWRYGWVTMGLVVLGVAIIDGVLLRNKPQDKDTTLMGCQDASLNIGVEDHTGHLEKTKRIMVHLGLIYALFGATYVVYATFVVTTLVNDYGYPERVAGNFWAVVGALSIFSGPLFGWLSDRLSRVQVC